ncbi:MAG TPA: GGDEF and EAL domain-containing protein [Ectothiorhodospiraceae bacterium]|nr:GGDEF and EAL domain-containing protein [Ectothiorhodospiraceae bacterium]
MNYSVLHPVQNRPVNSEQEQNIRFEQVKLQYKNLPISLVTVIVIGSLLAYAQWSIIDHTIISVWLLTLFMLTALRYAVYHRFNKAAPSKENIEPWHKYSLINATLSGLTWGSTGIYLFPMGDVVHQTVLAFVLAGMSAGAITTLASFRANIAAYLLPTLIPIIIRFYMEQTEVGVVMAVMVTIFLIMIGISARNSYYTLLESINLRFTHQRTKLALKESANLNQQILDTAAEGIFGVDLDGNTSFVNPAASRMLGYEPAELLGRPIHNTIHHSYPDGTNYENSNCPMYISIAQGSTQQVDNEMLWRKDGSGFYVDYISVPIIKDEKIYGAVVTFRDITKRRKVEAQLEHQALFDPLTDLPNRNLLINRIQQVYSRCIRRGHLGAVLYLDLDRFKIINEALGHKTGDQLIKQVAIRLRLHLRKEDTVAHLSGDEFVILLSEVGDDPDIAQKEIIGYANNVRKLLSEPYKIEGQLLHSTSSIGLTLFPMGNEYAESILQEADTAMYQAKELGRNLIHFYLPSMQLAADERLALENDLRQSLKNNEMQLHFQPQVDLAGVVKGAEVLLRWNHPTRGLISPADFIPLAEDTGLIISIGEWVLYQSCKLISNWKDEGLEQRHTLAVNVSPRQFRLASFVPKVKAILEETGADPTCLELELTEGIVVDNVEDTIEKMRTLRELGVRFALDDFGTGYSSLSYLKRLPLDKLKIDQTFVRDIGIGSNDATIIETIISMGRHLDLHVIAEGVETKEELEFLDTKGCHTYQGFYFSHPVEWESYKLFLLKNSSS